MPNSIASYKFCSHCFAILRTPERVCLNMGDTAKMWFYSGEMTMHQWMQGGFPNIV